MSATECRQNSRCEVSDFSWLYEIAIPYDMTETEIPAWLCDIFHEAATDPHPDVKRRNHAPHYNASPSMPTFGTYRPHYVPEPDHSGHRQSVLHHAVSSPQQLLW